MEVEGAEVWVAEVVLAAALPVLSESERPSSLWWMKSRLRSQKTL